MGPDYSTGAHAAPVDSPAAYPSPADGRDELIEQAGERSLGDLLSQVTSDLSQLMRQELELAKAEARQEAKKAGKAAGMFGGAGFAGYMVALFATVALMAALAAVMPWGWAALIVAALWGLVAFVLYSRGRSEMRRVQALPRTKETLKEDAEWARHPTS
ncbi:MAG: phage holin family protein [Frankiaceae bacterium]